MFNLLTDKQLYKNKYVSVNVTDEDYAYIANKPGVVVVPLRVVSSVIEVLVRRETHQLLGEVISFVTGRSEINEKPLLTAIRELQEEAGLYNIDPYNFVEIGDVYYGRSQPVPDKLFFVLAQEASYETPITDGSIHEQISSNFWLNTNELSKLIITASDPLFLSIAAKLLVVVKEMV